MPSWPNGADGPACCICCWRIIATISSKRRSCAARGQSGPDGLAAMAPVVERASLRILRPLLPIASARLRATLRALGQDWIDDPSNRNDAFARVRIRAQLAQYAAAAIDGLGGATEDRARARRASSRTSPDMLATSVAVYPEGWARIDIASLARLARATWRAAPWRGWS